MARRVMGDSRSEAEKAFKAAATKPPELPAAPAPSLPRRQGNGIAAHRSRRARYLPGRRTGMAGPHQRGIAQSGGEMN